ncbi:MAG: PASTA domain-containing protein [Candidatus Ancillula sp.]|nr:PASTA domain-containing protein [Candidatus Ancillula sp.]
MGNDDGRIGLVVDDRYKILEKIAHGGMATVYLALDKRLDREVAIKLMHPHLANGPEGATFVSRFRREARAAARLHHPGIVTVFDQGIDNSISYLTMEYVKGTNLRRRLKDVGTFAVGDALKNIENILRALAVAHHAGLVHRDIKPENILINSRGQLQITDFGLARVATEMSTATTGTVFGTVAYLAPEIIETGQSDPRSDVYSVGIMLYEMIAGIQPYQDVNKEMTPIQVAFKHVNEDVPVLSTLYPEVPRSVALLIEVFCARDEAKRPDNAAKALELLTKVARQLTMSEVMVHLPRPVLNYSSSGLEAGVAAGAAAVAASNLDLDNRSDLGLPSFDEDSTSTDLTSEEMRNYDQAHQDQDQLPTNMLTNTDIQSLRTNSSGVNRVVPAADEFEAEQDLFDEAKEKKAKRTKIVLFSILGVLLVAVIGCGIYWYNFFGPGAQVVIPNGIVNSLQTDAVTVIDKAELKYSVEEAYSDSVEKGKVIDVEPKSGESVSKYSSGVKLTVSKGVQSLDFPVSLVGMSEGDAKELLKSSGFTNIQDSTHSFNNQHPKGDVIAVDPAEGTKNVPHNQKVTLAVSDGPKPFALQNFAGMSIEEVAAILEPLGIKYIRSDVYSDSVEKGKVVDQATVPGTTVYEGDTISLNVSKGSETVAVPNLVRMTKDQAKSKLDELGIKMEVTGEQLLGIVQKQSVEPGAKVKRDSSIVLTIV